MPQAADRIFISIGVSRPGGGLDELPGAITAAERMAAWATAQRYATVLVHDRKYSEVTVDLLRNEIGAAIKRVTDQAALKRLVVFFAGHGAAMAVGDQYWILTNWNMRPTEAVKVSSLQRMLEYYGPRQVAIIGDACQEFSARFSDLVGSPVLDKPDEEQRPYELDQFFAVDAGKQAFMIKAAGDRDAFCLFTEVLLDALEGDAPLASYEQIGGDVCVTSQSLAVYLDGNVAQEAGKYGVRMIPRPRPGFYTDRVYLTLPPVPAVSPPAPPPTMLPPDGTSSGAGGVAAHWATGAAPEDTPEIRWNTSASTWPKRIRSKPPRSPPAALVAENEAVLQEREARRQAFAQEVGQAARHDHSAIGCGVCISGAEVAKVEASFGEVSPVDGDPNLFRIRLDDAGTPLGWSDTLVTLADGRVCSVCVVDGFVALLHVLDDASLSMFHRPIDAIEGETRFAVALLARAHAGVLGQDEIVEAAALLRGGKHRIITVGCIAAQFYDTVRDVDSLRALASFYATHGWPVPLDVVLYGGGRIHEYGGRLYADISPAPALRPRTHHEARHDQSFTSEATAGIEGHPVAGRVPWMRHAWGAVSTADCDASAEPWRRQALAAMAHLASGSFTNAQPAEGQALAELAAVEARQLAVQHLTAV